jgi:hypothetical protein
LETNVALPPDICAFGEEGIVFGEADPPEATAVTPFMVSI